MLRLLLLAWCAVAPLARADEALRFHTWVAYLPEQAAPEGIGDYRTADAIWREIADLLEERPGVVTPERIGTTHDNRPLWAFHCVSPTVPVHRKVLVFGGIHAMEWIAAEVATDALIACAHHPPPGVAVTFVPLLNPDGRSKVEADLRAGETRWRRGNRLNVDLNRDFAVNREPRAVWAKLPVTRMFYAHSDAPLSQPETRALDGLADQERFHRAVSLHAFGAFHYYPWAGRFQRPPDRAAFQELGYAMSAAQVGPRAYRVRQLGRNFFFFRAQGAEIDHLYGLYGTRAFLIELTRSGASVRHPRHFWPYFRRYNPDNREVHVQDGLAALWALYTYPTLPGEVGDDGNPVIPAPPRPSVVSPAPE
jgi:hypothetical protein